MNNQNDKTGGTQKAEHFTRTCITLWWEDLHDNNTCISQIGRKNVFKNWLDTTTKTDEGNKRRKGIKTQAFSFPHLYRSLINFLRERSAQCNPQSKYVALSLGTLSATSSFERHTEKVPEEWLSRCVNDWKVARRGWSLLADERRRRRLSAITSVDLLYDTGGVIALV